VSNLPKGKQKLRFGCYYTMSPGKNLTEIKTTLTIKWYAWPFLFLKECRKKYEIKWFEYPRLIYLIIMHTLRLMTKKEIHVFSDKV
jgi:hypothetical protein